MNEPTKISVLLVDDHFLARLALSTLIGDQPDLSIVATATTGEEAVACYRQHRPDLVVMDLRLPGLDGLAATRAICAENQEARIVVLSNHDTPEDIRRALEAGARAYCKKDVSGDELLGTLRRVHAGERAVRQESGSEEKTVDLTPREREVLALVFQGLTNKQIGEALTLSPGTVRIYVSNILLKLGVDRRTEAVAVALRRGLLRAE